MTYSVLTFAMSAAIVPAPSDPMYPPMLEGTDLLAQLVNTTVGVLLVGGLAGSLARRLRRSAGELARMTASREDLAAVHDDVLRSIPVGLLTTDREGRINGANPAQSISYASR